MILRSSIFKSNLSDHAQVQFQNPVHQLGHQLGMSRRGFKLPITGTISRSDILNPINAVIQLLPKLVVLCYTSRDTVTSKCKWKWYNKAVPGRTIESTKCSLRKSFFCQESEETKRSHSDPCWPLARDLFLGRNGLRQLKMQSMRQIEYWGLREEGKCNNTRW